MIARPLVFSLCLALLPTGAAIAQIIEAPAGIGTVPSSRGEAMAPEGGRGQTPSSGAIPVEGSVEKSSASKAPVGGAGAASSTSSGVGVGTGVGGPPGTGALPGTGGTSGGPGGINR
ncbi:hypothetical protein FPV16_17195 [Methylobacterium sp. W2]|uniref:hypothetical protein n=1 Tax=Methylobacterium sp. W2 TaxID=2598107 RepID=UPI001D0C4DFF|nr:hypothetical protein [Methylobacterium sp. W2]MCC0807923.1 hypothetical protein [Methylobacterium sp. W2]